MIPVMPPVCYFGVIIDHSIVEAESCLEWVVKARGRSKSDAQLFNNINPRRSDILENSPWSSIHNLHGSRNLLFAGRESLPTIHCSDSLIALSRDAFKFPYASATVVNE